MNHSNPAQAVAKQSLKTGSRTFFFASLLMTADVAEKAARLYHFCRHVDDLVDLSTDTTAARARIAEWIQALACGQACDAAMADAMNLFRDCGIPDWIPIELLRGVESDLDPVAVETEDELLQYCFRVAGTVGLMMCHVMGVVEPESRRHAVDLGIAMQLTNIMRDVTEDARLGRRYLPGCWIPGISTKAILSPDFAQEMRIRQGLKRLYALAEVYYASGFRGLPFIPLGSRYAILVAGRTYRRIGELIRARHYDYRQPRAVVSLSSKLHIAVQALIRAAFTPQFWIRPQTHENRLHTPIAIYPVSSVH